MTKNMEHSRTLIDKTRSGVIIVAAHKKYRMPQTDLYLPVHVGAAGKDDLGYARDDWGDNISAKNNHFCELTGLYWAYKNLNPKYLGLVHYRRFLGERPFYRGNKYDNLLTRNTVDRLFERYDVIVPKKQHYVIESVASHYMHTHNAQELEVARQIIAELYPAFVKDWDDVMNRRSAHMFNMFVMKYEEAQSYCEWMFSILFELEKRIDLSQYDAFQARLFGRISEFLLDVWINHRHLTYAEMPVVYMGNIDWPRKIVSFLKARFAGVKYERSF